MTIQQTLNLLSELAVAEIKEIQDELEGILNQRLQDLTSQLIKEQKYKDAALILPLLGELILPLLGEGLGVRVRGEGEELCTNLSTTEDTQPTSTPPLTPHPHTSPCPLLTNEKCFLAILTVFAEKGVLKKYQIYHDAWFFLDRKGWIGEEERAIYPDKNREVWKVMVERSTSYLLKQDPPKLKFTVKGLYKHRPIEITQDGLTYLEVLRHKYLESNGVGKSAD